MLTPSPCSFTTGSPRAKRCQLYLQSDRGGTLASILAAVEGMVGHWVILDACLFNLAATAWNEGFETGYGEFQSMIANSLVQSGLAVEVA